MKKTTKSGLIVLILLILAMGGYVTCSVLNISIFTTVRTVASQESYRVAEDSIVYDPIAAKSYKNKFIAALYIEGTISEANQSYNQKWLISTIRALKNNEKNAAIAIYINSPGGAVYQADEVYLALNDYKTTGRPIYVYQGPMAASGGYYISCAGTKIFANRNTITGCIGVIMGSSYDLTGLFDKLGIKATTIHSGANKNMMNYDEPLTEEQKAIMQSISDECYDQFVSIVAKERGLQYNTVCKLSDGRIYTAKQALDHKLIDAIDSWENMLCSLAEGELKMPGIKVISYKYERRPQTLLEMLTTKALEIENARAAAQLGIPAGVMESINDTSYLPMYLAQ